MALLRAISLVFVIVVGTGCQLGYYLHSAYHQTKINSSREPIERVLKSGKVSDAEKRKLRLVQETKKFAEEKLGLKKSRNYTSYVKLDSPYVTYIVQAAYPFELKPYEWKFPFVGKVPYKGYFRKELAEKEAARLREQGFDTSVRGVSAYSTLGWFEDAVLSSMLKYEDYDLVELIIHETIHTTLFIKNAAEFNERMATFLGREGMILFYRETEGDDSENIKKALADSEDQRIFSTFLSRELEDLKKWYEERKGQTDPAAKAERLSEIQKRFLTEVKPKLRTSLYDEFGRRTLNNAVLLAYRTYEYELEDFAKLYRHFGGDFHKTLAYLKTLEKSKKPDQKLKEFVSGLGAAASIPGVTSTVAITF